MNAKFRDIFNTLNALVTFKVDKSMSDDDFIANIDAINLMCNIYDDLGLDCTEIRRDMDKLYSQFSRRVYEKIYIQLAMPLIKALYRYIYGRGVDNADRGPVNRWNTFIEMCCKAVAAYKAKPIIHSSDYLYALGIVSRMRDDFDCCVSKEYSASVNASLKDLDNVSNEEKIRRLKAYQDSVGDIIDIKIDADMSVSTLYALETIFYLRLQLAQVSWAENEPIYESLCRDRFEQIANALTKKYRTAKSLNEKIEILERLEVISLTPHSDHSRFVLKEVSIIEDEQNLTYAQKLRLKWLPGMTPEDDSKIVAEFLLQTDSSFEMETLALITDFCTDEERAAIFDRYLEMFDAALAANDTPCLFLQQSIVNFYNICPGMYFNGAKNIVASSIPWSLTDH